MISTTSTDEYRRNTRAVALEYVVGVIRTPTPVKTFANFCSFMLGSILVSRENSRFIGVVLWSEGHLTLNTPVQFPKNSKNNFWPNSPHFGMLHNCFFFLFALGCYNGGLDTICCILCKINKWLDLCLHSKLCRDKFLCSMCVSVSFLLCLFESFFPDRIPSTTPGAEPPGDAKDSGSARPHSTHLETSSTNRP